MQLTTWCQQMGIKEEEARQALSAAARLYGDLHGGEVLDVTFDNTTWRVGINFDGTFWAVPIPLRPDVEKELREVEFDIQTIQAELQHPWSLEDAAFLEQELEKLYNYRHKLKNF